MSLQNELLSSNSLSDADDGFGSYVPGPGETINPDGTYGGDLNWEDSFGPASKHLGVSEAQWRAFIDGINTVKDNMRQWEEGGGNSARVMQDRSIPNAMRDRLIMRFMREGMTEDEAFAAALEHPSIQELMSNNDYYNEMNDALNALYASVGLDPSGSITGGTGVNHSGDYAVNFDFLTGDVSHTKGDAIHDFGKGLIKGIATAAFGAGLTSYLGSLGLSQGTASAISKAVTSMVSGSGGELTVEDALGFALGPGGEFADVDIGGEIKDAVVDYVTNPDNYDDNNVIVWGEHGGTDEMGNPVINIPNYSDWMEEDEEAGGGGADSSASTESPDSTTDSTADSDSDSASDSESNSSSSAEEITTDADWVWDEERGAWVNPESGEIIYGPNNETGTMSDEEMNNAWESGDYSWEPPDPNVGDSDFDDNPVGWIWDASSQVWNPVFRDTEIPEGAVVAPTSTKPTSPPPSTDVSSDATGGDVTGDVTGGDVTGGGTTGDVTGGGTTGGGTAGGGTTGGGTTGEGTTGTDTTGSSDTTGEDDTGDGTQGTGDTGDGVDGDGDDGTGEGSGGDGSGTGKGGSGAGMLTGMGGAGKAQPKWGELFAYTTLTPYQKTALTPMIDYIKQAKGMMS